MQGNYNGVHEELRRMSNVIRQWIIARSLASEVGHIGSAFSIADIIAVLWGHVLRNPGTDVPDRDRFVLAKGHAALALYCALKWKGLISEADFASYCLDGSIFAAHPEQGIPSVEVATGSLGQGLSVAAGMALGLRRDENPARVFALLSDAECNEGQVWEAVMFAAHQQLSNLIAIVDVNGMQALGRTEEILDTSPMADKWQAFGWEAVTVDGHDVAALLAALTSPRPERGKPLVVLAQTVLGKGVSFMHDKLEWHYRNLNPELAATALVELGGNACEQP